ncbi:MAG: hypothetical protein V4710_07045 [Verrucomicrobiota bacterium]
MRFSPLLFLALFCLGASSLFAQDQEKKLMERLSITPDQAQKKGMVFDTRNLMGAPHRSMKTGQANVKEFGGAQKFNAKSFQSREFAGTKSSWFGDFKFGTKTKETGKFETKAARTKTMAVSDAREAGKTMASRDLPDGGRTFLGKERNKLNHQPSEQELRTFDRSELVQLQSIDDIRELLNKSK